MSTNDKLTEAEVDEVYAKMDAEGITGAEFADWVEQQPKKEAIDKLFSFI